MRARHLYVDGVRMGRCGANKGIAIITLAAAVFGWTLGGCAGVSAGGENAGTNTTHGEAAQVDSEESQCISVYQAGEAFELTGEERTVEGDGSEAAAMPWEYGKLWDWTGTMRFSVSGLMVYGSAEEAGFPEAQADLGDGEKLAVFEVSALNVDAVCRQSVIDESGVSNFNLTMFTLERADGTPIEGRFFNGSQVDGLEMHNGGDGSNRAWVEQGESATYRIACVLSADVDKDTEYKVNCCGAIDQDAPTVYLGKAVFV